MRNKNLGARQAITDLSLCHGGLSLLCLNHLGLQGSAHILLGIEVELRLC